MGDEHGPARGEGAHPQRPTLELVAREAGVSRQTVSNALNHPELLAEETRDQVMAAVRKLGYRPSRAARQLRTRSSRTFAMRLEPTRDGINGSVLDRFLHALVERAQREGYHVVLFTAADDGGEVEAYADLLLAADIDGVVVTGSHHGDARPRWLREQALPFVVFGRPWGEPDDVHDWVDIDGRAGTRAAVEHLVARGHRRIAYLGWPTGSGSGDDRRSGWAQAVPGGPERAAAAGWDVRVDDGVESGRRATEALLAVGEPPSAVVCASDSLALGALAAAGGVDGGPGAATGVPGRTPSGPPLAVVGFDDTPVAQAVGLSSVAQPVAEAARASTELLLQRLAAPGAPARHLLLEPRLVVRRSS